MFWFLRSILEENPKCFLGKHQDFPPKLAFWFFVGTFLTIFCFLFLDPEEQHRTRSSTSQDYFPRRTVGGNSTPKRGNPATIGGVATRLRSRGSDATMAKTTNSHQEAIVHHQKGNYSKMPK